MIEIDMTQMVPKPEMRLSIGEMLPERTPQEWGLFLVVSRFDCIPTHAITYLIAKRRRADLKLALRRLVEVLGDDVVVVDTNETLPDEGAAAARLEQLRGSTFSSRVLLGPAAV